MIPRSQSAPKPLTSFARAAETPSANQSLERANKLKPRLKPIRSRTAVPSPTLLSPRTESLELPFNVPDGASGGDTKQWTWLRRSAADENEMEESVGIKGGTDRVLQELTSLPSSRVTPPAPSLPAATLHIHSNTHDVFALGIQSQALVGADEYIHSAIRAEDKIGILNISRARFVSSAQQHALKRDLSSDLEQEHDSTVDDFPEDHDALHQLYRTRSRKGTLQSDKFAPQPEHRAFHPGVIFQTDDQGSETGSRFANQIQKFVDAL